MVLATDLMKKAIFQQGHAFSLMTGCKIFIRIDDPKEHVCSSLYYGSKELVKEYHSQGLRASGAQVDGESGSPLNNVNSCVRHMGSVHVNVGYKLINQGTVDVDSGVQNTEQGYDRACNHHQESETQIVDGSYNEASNDHQSESLNNVEYNAEGRVDTEAGNGDRNGFSSETVDSLDIIKKEVEQLPCASLDIIKKEVEQLPCALQSADAYDSPEQTGGRDRNYTPGVARDDSDGHDEEGGQEHVNTQTEEAYLQHNAIHNSISENMYTVSDELANAMPGIVYQCVYCNKVFDTKQQLEHHVENYHDENRSYICTECGETFRKIGNLKSHQKVHSGLKPYGCDICGRMFARSAHLKGHKYTHEKESPYKCQICGSCFTNGYNLKRHMLRHGGKKQHHCSMCTLTFYRRDQLLAHERCHMKKMKR